MRLPLTYVELFAGAGGLSRGLDAAGFAPIAHCEIEPHARAVLRYHWPDVRLDGDVTAVNGADFRGATVISGGSPCQDLSVAGKRAGLGGARSGLFHEQVRIWRESGAPYLLWENVLGALSSNNGKDFGTVLSTLVGAAIPVPSDGWRSGGVAAGPEAVAAWRVLDLQHFGPPQRRMRVFIVAARTGGVDPAEVLALSEGVCGHPSPRQQARQRAAVGAEGGTQGSQQVMNVVPTMVKNGDSNSGFRDTDGVVVQCATGDVTQALNSIGADASEDGTGRGTPVVVYGNSGMERWAETDVTVTACVKSANNVVIGTLDFGGHGGSYNGQDAYQGRIREEARRPRRLTPLECERLMSWPDQWTRYGRKEDGTQYELSDTARYRLAGNGVGSVCAEWIGKRLADAIENCPFT